MPRLASSRCRRDALSGAVTFVGHCRRGRLLTSLSTCSATSQHLSHGHTRGSAGETSGSRQTWRQREGLCWTHGRAAPSKSRAEVVMVEQERPSPALRGSTGFLHQRPSSTSVSTTTAARWRRRGSVALSLALTHSWPQGLPGSDAPTPPGARWRSRAAQTPRPTALGRATRARLADHRPRAAAQACPEPSPVAPSQPPEVEVIMTSAGMLH